MGNVANTIYMAVVSHTSWKKRLHDMIETDRYEANVAVEHCEFSQWIQANRSELELYKNFTKVEELHKQFHIEAAKIIQLAKRGKKQQAEAALNYGGAFETISQDLVRNIIAWHDEVLGK